MLKASGLESGGLLKSRGCAEHSSDGQSGLASEVRRVGQARFVQGLLEAASHRKVIGPQNDCSHGGKVAEPYKHSVAHAALGHGANAAAALRDVKKRRSCPTILVEPNGTALGSEATRIFAPSHEHFARV